MDNGRYGGGSAGAESRYHFPAADCERKEDANEGATVKSPHHGEMPVRVPEAKLNTMDGPGRGAVAGVEYGQDKGQNGFCK